MVTQPTTRRLAAMLHADVAGFTRMMEGAQTMTFRHLKAAQINVWRPAIETGGGRLVGTAGDAMLAEFSSALAAVRTAIDIQDRMGQFNAALDAGQRMLFRVGVHLGEVIVDPEDDNIFGESVNLCARIQALAEPGGVAVSRTVRDMVELGPGHAFAEGGTHQVKNVSRPVELFHVRSVAVAPPVATRAAHPVRGGWRLEGADSSGNQFRLEIAAAALTAASGGLVLGRAADQCDLCLSHPTVSRRHACLGLRGETLSVADLGSTNGISVDGRLLPDDQPVDLADSSRLRVGDVEFVVRRT